MRDIKISRSSHGQESAYSLWPRQKGWRWEWEREMGQVETSANKCYTYYTFKQDVWLILLLYHSLSGHNKWRQICFHFMRSLLTRRTLAKEQGAEAGFEHNIGHLLLLLCDEFIVRRLSLAMLTHIHLCT